MIPKEKKHQKINKTMAITQLSKLIIRENQENTNTMEILNKKNNTKKKEPYTFFFFFFLPSVNK